MYWRTFSNTSSNVMKIVTDKNGAKFRQKYCNIYGHVYGNPWRLVVTRSIKAQEIPKTKIGNSESRAHSYILTAWNIKNWFPKYC